MKNIGYVIILLFTTILISCNSEKSKPKNEKVNQKQINSDTLTKHLKSFNKELPTNWAFYV